MSSFLQILLENMQDLPPPGQELIAKQQAQQAMAMQAPQTRHVNLPPAMGTTLQAQPLGGQTRTVEAPPAQGRMVEAQPLGGDDSQMADVAPPPRKQTPPRLSARAVAELLKHITST